MTAAPSIERRRGVCPVCERFIGPVDTCPYCDASGCAPLRMRTLRWASLVLALGGAAALYYAARLREVPRIDLGRLTPAMNGAFVRAAGTVAAAPRSAGTNGASDYLSFRLDDGSGAIQVTAYDACAERLAAEGRVPRRGDRVEATGTLVFRGPFSRRLVVDSPGQIVLLERAASSAAPRRTRPPSGPPESLR